VSAKVTASAGRSTHRYGERAQGVRETPLGGRVREGHGLCRSIDPPIRRACAREQQQGAVSHDPRRRPRGRALDLELGPDAPEHRSRRLEGDAAGSDLGDGGDHHHACGGQALVERTLVGRDEAVLGPRGRACERDERKQEGREPRGRYRAAMRRTRVATAGGRTARGPEAQRPGTRLHDRR